VYSVFGFTLLERFVDFSYSVHDGDIVPMLAALDLYHDKKPLPVTHVATDRNWRTSQVTPMGGRVIFERLSCQQPGSSKKTAFVRVNVNDGIVAIPGCESGPGQSCPLQKFIKRVQSIQDNAGDFRAICGLKSDAPDRISFLHQ
jgi:acid phosphatase